jgi:DNA-binding CsgD family transcriptional regulator/tetratricopeptide (TPR) repeat protein
VSANVVSPVFIGRQDEMRALERLLDRAQARDAAFALIGGEAGVGKTRLARELGARAAGEGFCVLTGQCVELGAEGLPLAPLVDALRTLARTMPPDVLAGVLGPAAPGLSRLLPELAPLAAGRASGGALAAPAGEDMQKAQLLELVLGTLGRLSGVAPVLFTVEDVHWADRSTLDLTAFLIRSLRNARVLVVVTYRSDELHRRHPLRPLLTSWERDRSIDRIDLRRFDRDEVGAQLHAILGEAPGPAVTETVFDRSGGNAYLVEELAGTVKAHGDPADLPPSLADVLLSRVDALTPDAQKLLRTASVAGRAVPDRLLAEVAGLGENELFAALREAVENHLLVVAPDGQGYAFRHALTRDAVYEDMLPGERVRLHAAYGEALERDPGLAAGEAGQAGLATALAYHWYAALDLPRALPASIDAARYAMDSYAPAEALRHLERALEIWPRVTDAKQRTGLDRVEVSKRAGEAAYQSGALDRARSLLADAMAELPADADPVRRALLLERYAIVQRDSGATDEAAESLRQTLGLLPPGETTRAHAALLAALANALMRNDDMEGCAEAARNAIAAARACGATGAEADASVTLGAAMAYLGTVDTGLDVLRFGLRLALETAETEGSYTALRAYVNLSDVLELLSQHAEAAQVAADGLKLAERVGSSRTLGCYLVGNRAEPLLRLGRWAEADRLIAEALADQPEGVFGATLHQLRAELAAMRGGYAEAGSELRAASQTFSHTVDPQFTQPLRYVAALIAVHQGDLTRARDAVAAGIGDASEEWTSRYAWPVVWLAMRTEADDATRYRDRREDVPAAITARCAELAGVAARLATTAPALAGYGQLVAAEHARAAGTATAAEWAAAVAAWRAAEEPYPLSYALLRLAEAHVTAGETAEAEAAVDEAHALAQRLGAAPVAGEAAALARRARLNLASADGQASGNAGQPIADSGAADELARFGLTDREREVLLLVAAGRSNPEIAKTLFISAKTASVHVSNILAKLGVSGRVEAAAVVHRLGQRG